MSNEDQGEALRNIRSVLVVDDHPLYCDALAGALARICAPERIETASSMAEVLAAPGRPDLVLLDLRLPDVQGLSGFIELRATMPDVPIVVISAEADDAVIANVRALGGAGFIRKDAPRDALQAALAQVAEGGKSFPPGIAAVASGPSEDPPTADLARRLADLTPQQTRILRLICDGKPNKQIAYELSLAEATVKAHVTALLRRLGVRNRTQAALLVQGLSLGTPRGGEVHPQIG